MTSDIHARQRNDVTSRDPAHLYPWVDFVSVSGGVGKVGRHFLIETNFLSLIDHVWKIYGILVLYLVIR